MSFWAYRTLHGAPRYPSARDLTRVQVLRYETRANRELACASGAGISVLASTTARDLLLAAYRSRVLAGEFRASGAGTYLMRAMTNSGARTSRARHISGIGSRAFS